MTTARAVLAAAQTLREKAGAATPGPWGYTIPASRYGGLVGPTRATTRQQEVDGYGGELVGESLSPGISDWLRIVSPELGAALADLLEWHAQEAPGRLPAELADLIRCIEVAS